MGERIKGFSQEYMYTVLRNMKGCGMACWGKFQSGKNTEVLDSSLVEASGVQVFTVPS